jgi:flagellar hook-associated protein 2
VDDVSHFQEGRTILIADASGYEEATISEIDSVNNVLTISSNLSADYAETAYVTQLEGGRKFTFEPSDFDEMKAAQNAQVRVDGYPPSSWIEAEDNTMDGVIGGLSLTLLQETDGSPVTISVNRNTESVKAKIHALVSAYNAVRTYINGQTRYDPATGESGALLGNYGAGIVEALLRETVVTPATGFRDGTDPFTILGQVGIHTVGTAEDRNQLGTLEVDEGELDDALAEDFEGVVELFSANFSGASNSNYLTFYQASETLTTPGEYDVKVDFDVSGNITSAWMKSPSEDTYREADIEGDCIVGQSDNPEDSLWVLVEWDGTSSTQTATVRVKQGLAGELRSELDDLQDTDGLLENMDESCSERQNQIREQMEDEMARMAIMEERLNQKYARLESMLSELQGLQQWVTSMTQNMEKTTSMSKSQD